jgi:sensor histidine kinase regulating citrate/malate metabolism
MLIDNVNLKYGLTASVFICMISSIIWANFNFQENDLHTVFSLIFAFIYTSIMIPSFVWISMGINTETIKESVLQGIVYQRDGFRKIFNGLQEGIVIINSEGKIEFMNELSNKIFSSIANIYDFFGNCDVKGRKFVNDRVDIKMFYLFEN